MDKILFFIKQININRYKSPPNTGKQLNNIEVEISHSFSIINL